MAGQDISFEEVAAAAQALADEGRPVQLGSLQERFAAASATALHQHLTAWRAGRAAPAAPALAVPEAVLDALDGWARQLAEAAAAPQREGLAQAQDDIAALLRQLEQAQARLAERDAAVERLTMELRHARDIASEALVGKAKDQLAIEGKDAQLAELRRQIERHVAASAAESDARLAAEMELVGAVTARDNFAAEIAQLRAELDASRAAQGA